MQRCTSIAIRPEHFTFVEGGAFDQTANRWAGQVRTREFLGRLIEYRVDLQGTEVGVLATSAAPLPVGAEVWILASPRHCLPIGE